MCDPYCWRPPTEVDPDVDLLPAGGVVPCCAIIRPMARLYAGILELYIRTVVLVPLRYISIYSCAPLWGKLLRLIGQQQKHIVSILKL